MAWIELHQELPGHPKTKRVARLLNIPIAHAVGHLTCLWLWCLSYAKDGDLSAYTAEDIADAAGWGGDPDAFVGALAEAPEDRHGFIEAIGDALHVHDWHQYGGKLLEKKQRNAERMKAARADSDPATRFTQDGKCKACDAHVGADEVARADHVQSTCVARVVLEKRREEERRKKKPPKSPASGGPEFEAFWSGYPNKRCGKAMALKSWQKHKPTAELVALIMAGLERAKVSHDWTRDGGQYVPMATTWLNQERWTAVFGPEIAPVSVVDQAKADALRLEFENAV